MSVDNDSVKGMDLTALPANVFMVEWRDGKGEIEYVDTNGMRSAFYDLIPYAPFFQQYMTRLPSLSLTQAKKVQTDLIYEIYDQKRQLPIYYPVAAGSYTWPVDDGSIAVMGVKAIPTLISSLGAGEASEDSMVSKINALVDQINDRIDKINNYDNAAVDQTNTRVVAKGNTLIGEINTDIVTQGNSAFATINGVFDQLESDFSTQAGGINNALTAINNLFVDVETLVNSNVVTPANSAFATINNLFGDIATNIVTPGNAVITHLNNNVCSYLNNTVVGAYESPSSSTNTLNNKLQTRDITVPSPATYVAAPGLNGNIPQTTTVAVAFATIGVNSYTASAIDIGTNPYSAAGITVGNNSYTLGTITTQFQDLSYHTAIPHVDYITAPVDTAAVFQWMPIETTAPVNLSGSEVSGLMSTIATRRDNLLTVQKNKAAAVNALATVAAVIAYDVTTGW